MYIYIHIYKCTFYKGNKKKSVNIYVYIQTAILGLKNEFGQF